jgi:hypothetical protein
MNVCLIGGGAVSLRKSPTLTPALLDSYRRNARKSTGPRTAQGKARSRLNRFRHGMRSPEYINFFKAQFDAPLGEAGMTAQTLLSSQQVIHPLLMEAAELSMQTEIDICEDSRWARSRGK